MLSLSKYLRKKILTSLDKPQKNYVQRAYNNLQRLYGAIRPGDVILAEGRSEMSGIIRLFTGSHWTHAAFYVGDRLKDLSGPDGTSYAKKHGSDGDHMVVEAYSGQGVIASPLSNYQDYNIRICRPYGIEEDDLEKVVALVISRLGMHYDDQNILAIAMLALRKLLRISTKDTVKACLGNCDDFQVICSGMIAQAFQSVGYPIVPALLPKTQGDPFYENSPYGGGLVMRHYSQITPKDFDLSPNFNIIKYNLNNQIPFDYKALWADR